MGTSSEIVVSAVQMTAIDGEKERNVEKAMALVDEAGRRGSSLCVLPELWTGLAFSDETSYRGIAETIPGAVTDALAERARKYGMYIAGSMYERGAAGAFHNSMPLIAPDGSIPGVYRKTHLFDAPRRVDIARGVMESERVTAGDELPVFETALGRLGLSVCSDLRFPEIYREMTLKGATVLLCASAFLSPRYDHWEFFLRARATENQCFVVASGQYGTEPKSGLSFVGRSMIVDPWGVIVATASDAEGLASSVISMSLIEETRHRYSLLQQRRPELYKVLRGGGTA